MKKRTAAQNGRRSRRKGHDFERDIAIALRGVFPEARRNLEYHQLDATGIDIDHTGDYCFQCKKTKTYASITKIKEIRCEPALGDVPVLVTAADDEPIMAVLPFEDLLRLIAIAEGI